MKDDKDKYIPIVTKVSKHAAERLEALAKTRGMTKYEIIQMSVDTLIRYMEDRHNLTEEMEQAMNIFEHMIGWENALNLADPTVNREIAEAVYIMQDPEGKKKGYRAVMVEKPFMDLWTQTANVQKIFERLFNILMPQTYMKFYRAKILLECSSVVEVLNILADAEVLSHMNDEYRREFEDAARADNGKSVGYGRKTHSYQHRTPDSVATDQRIKFDDYDKELSESEANDG